MAEKFTMYPTLTDDMKKQLSFVMDDWKFSYNDGDDFFIIPDNKTETGYGYTAVFKDPRGVWSADNFEVTVSGKVQIENYSVLFGPNGIAPDNAEIGVALRWISTGSDCRGIVDIGSFYRNKISEAMYIEHTFMANNLKGSLVIEIILYLKNAGLAGDNERHLARNEGTVLGMLSSCEFFIDGNGSVFPVSEVNKPGEALWWVYYNENADPFEDKFNEDNVVVLLNSAHPNYKFLKIGNSLKESPLFLEVISSALMIIIESVKESAANEWEQIIKGEDYETGSIAQAVNYFVNKLGWDISSPVRLSLSIRQFFDQNLQGGVL